MKTPSAGTPISPFALLRAFFPIGNRHALQIEFQHRFGVSWCGLSGSGTSAIYASLCALKKQNDRTRVILPAYTAPSLILPIRKAGLTPILCDVSPETLNAGAAEILPQVDRDTLAVMPVHMFGMPTDVPIMNRQLASENVFVVEDAASAMGATIDQIPVGTQSDIGIYSFNRGKNLSTFAGGVILSNREDLVPDLQLELATFPAPNLTYALKIRLFTIALCLVVHPLGYTLLHPLASKFKYTSLHTDFHIWAYTNFQARLAKQLLKKFDPFTQKREQNAAYLRHTLSEIEGIKMPRILPNSRPAYNQFPILLPDEKTRGAVHNAVVSTGLEATLLYPDPIHRLYHDIWDGMSTDPYPNATAISKRLLLIPVHPLVSRQALDQAIDAIGKTMKKAAA